ncbi:conjugative transposon protein TraM [Paramuribaculum intestinale]|uniref:Conjugative transposon protein TraM n=2 Tax=Paramuribaculum intestinale TaxID=2094151 RepID=A0A2V1IQ57_9BACT|nr:conjugative transposon protein TraM [Paramuribaculum intestinale]PWB06466.1 conjugative transposon protein TraM [Paramuribaculum intestinale]WLT42453.1 conjugative transposon protein TraM [Paramuribaculum intestinale]
MTFEKLKAKVNGWIQPKTEKDRQNLKKYAIVFPAMFLSFLVALWLIFGGSFSKEETDTSKANMELPDGDSQEIEGNKLKAIEEQAILDEKARRDSVAVSYAETVDTIATPSPSTVPDPIETSAQAYQEAQASLQDFYIPEDNSAAQVMELQARIDELEAQNAMAQQSQQPNEMELMEQSYKLAAQYLGTGNGSQQAVIVDEPEKDRKVMPVNQVNRNVVSSLSASADNTRSFSTAVGIKHKNFKNTISACIATDQAVIDGQSVRLRTLEPMWIGNSLLPKNTSIVGVARLQGERLEIKIENIEALGCIMEVDLSVYDSDGQEGINIPNSMESDALHEIGANMGSTMGSSINLTTNAGAQLVSDVGKGLINGVSQYLNKKLRTVKVHLKSGYKVMLRQNEQ